LLFITARVLVWLKEEFAKLDADNESSWSSLANPIRMSIKWRNLAKHSLVKSLFFATTVIHAIAARKTRLTWVNGIAYMPEHMQEGQREISKFFGNKPVIYCHNPTGMAHDDDMLGYLGDIAQAGTQKLGRITAEVDSLVRHLKEAVLAVGSRGRVIHIAHSQGALITALASKQLSPLEMNQIEVLAFGGAAALRKTPQTPFQRCINYYAVNDPLLWVVPSAAQALRSGFVGDKEFCFLAPRIGDPIEDHNLLGPTYAQALQWEGARFRREHQTLVFRAMQSFWLVLLFLLEALSDRLHAMLVVLIRPFLIWSILCFMWTRHVAIQLARIGGATVVQPSAVLLTLLQEVLRSCRGEEKFASVSSVADKSRE
jgi:hypothetical protein